jgi:hypothetical protein
MRVLLILGTILYTLTVSAFNPQKVIDDWQSCQMFSSLDDECLKLRDDAISIRDNVEDLQQSPQAYGVKIMSLQYQKSLTTDAEDVEKIDRQLEVMLAIVGWLESPK